MRNTLYLIFLVLFVTLDAHGQEETVDTTSLRSSDQIFQFVDSMAMPVGGYEPFYRYIGMNIQYPKAAREKKSPEKSS